MKLVLVFLQELETRLFAGFADLIYPLYYYTKRSCFFWANLIASVPLIVVVAELYLHQEENAEILYYGHIRALIGAFVFLTLPYVLVSAVAKVGRTNPFQEHVLVRVLGVLVPSAFYFGARLDWFDVLYFLCSLCWSYTLATNYRND